MSPFFLYNPSIFYRMGHDPMKANLCAPCRGVAADRKVRAIPRRGEGTPPCRWLRVHPPFQNALYGTVLTVPGRCNKIPQRHLAPLGSQSPWLPTPRRAPPRDANPRSRTTRMYTSSTPEQHQQYLSIIYFPLPIFKGCKREMLPVTVHHTARTWAYRPTAES